MNDSVNVNNKKTPKYTEIFKLAAELVERDVWFEFEVVATGDFKRAYLFYPEQYSSSTKPDAVVKQGTGTKGFEDGLLEITGLLYPEEAAQSEDGTLGWLTAGNVLERILKKEAEKC